MNKKLLVFIMSAFVVANSAIAAGKSINHKHNGRSHSHPLPNTGFNHSHNGVKKVTPKKSTPNKVIIYEDSFSLILQTEDGKVKLSTTLAECRARKGIALIETSDKKQTFPYALTRDKEMVEICTQALKRLKKKAYGVLYPKSIIWNEHRAGEFTLNGEIGNYKGVTFVSNVKKCIARKGKFSMIRDSDDEYSISINVSEHAFNLDYPTDHVAKELCKIAIASHQSR